MPNELREKLSKLLAVFHEDLIDRTAYDNSIAKLKVEFGNEAVEHALTVLLPQPPKIPETNIAAAVGASLAPTSVTHEFAGYAKSSPYERQLDSRLTVYLRATLEQCLFMPFLGLHDQRDINDKISVNLAQIYTQMTSRQLMPREHFTLAQLQATDIIEFISSHREEMLPPHEQRSQVRIRFHDSQQSRRNITLPGLESQILSDGSLELEIRGRGALVIATLNELINDRAITSVTFYGPQLATEAAAQHQHLVLLGGPGSGKSTVLRYLGYALAETLLNPSSTSSKLLPGWADGSGYPLPIYTSILQIAQRIGDQQATGCADDLWRYISELILQLDPSGESLEPVCDEIRNGNAILLLDGLDEVAGATARTKIIEAISDFMHMEPQCRIVVTCRERAYERMVADRLWQHSWPVEHLAQWTVGQTSHFVNIWYEAAAKSAHMPEVRYKGRITQLLMAIKSREDLARLGMQPLLLTIMSLVHFNDGRLPEDRVSLYSRCIEILLEQWDLAGRNHHVYGRLMDFIGLPGLDAKRMRPLLEDVAFHAHEGTKGNVGSLAGDPLYGMVFETLLELKHPNPKDGATKFLLYADQRAGLLHATETQDYYAFAHQTFQEYLAGLRLVRDVEFVEQIMMRRFDERWRVPIQLAMGHCVAEGAMAMPFQLLRQLLDMDGRTERQRQRDVIFAADIAADVAWDRLEKGGEHIRRLRAELAEQLGAIVESRDLSNAERINAGHLLGITGDRRPGVCTLAPRMVQIEGGPFRIGTLPDPMIASDRDNTTVLAMPDYEISRYPVTNAQYERFLGPQGSYNSDDPWWDDASRHWLRIASESSETRETFRQRVRHQPELWSERNFAQHAPNHPVVGVSWFEATAYCRWLTATLNDGHVYTLPSELEWEYAARGPQGRAYPWGDQNAVINIGQSESSTVPVGCFSQLGTPAGVLDMLRNIWEWTRSVYQPYPYDPHDGREAPADPLSSRFVLRGAGLAHAQYGPRCADRTPSHPSGFVRLEVGFRVVRFPKQ